jgi:hypothetical protein
LVKLCQTLDSLCVTGDDSVSAHSIRTTDDRASANSTKTENSTVRCMRTSDTVLAKVCITSRPCVSLLSALRTWMLHTDND